MRTCMHGHRYDVPSNTRRLVPPSPSVATSRNVTNQCQCHGPGHQCRHVLSAHKFNRQQSQATAGGSTAVTQVDDSIESVISDVLNANRARIQRPADLLAVLDSTGNGIQTTVNRSWDTTGVALTLKGTWAKTAEARKMAMLTVYQERHVRRAAVVLQFFRYLAKSRPGLLDTDTTQQLEAAAAANQLNPAIEGLMVPQLTQMVAGVYPWAVLQRAVEQAVQAATQSLLQKPPYNYSSNKRQAAQQQLRWVEASLARGAAFARLRALLQQQGQLQQQQQQQQGGEGGRMLTPEQAYFDAWQQQQQQQQGFADSGTTAAGLSGKCMFLSFKKRSVNSPYLLKHTPGCITSTAAASAAAGGGSEALAAVDGAAAGEVVLLCNVVNKLTDHVRQLQQGLPGGREATLGVLPEVQRCHRAVLLDLCVCWAESSPAVTLDPLPATAVAKVAVSSLEHNRLLRRIGLESSGPEVQVLRQLAVSKGASFLAHFSPTVGNPFAGIAEWDYFRECPGVWNRFVVDPPTQTATLLFKAAKAWQQQQGGNGTAAAAAGGVEVHLSQYELQQLIQQLVAALSNGSSSSSSAAGKQTAAAAATGSLSTPGTRAVSLTAAAASSSNSAASVAGDLSGPRLLLLIDGAAAAELSPVHVTSLITVIDDLVTQLPGQYNTLVQDVQVAHARPLQQLLGTAAAWISSSSRALAAAALLALPLLAIARPFRGLQHVPPPVTTTTTTAAAAAAVSPGSTAASSSSSSGVVPGQQQQRLLRVNDYVIPAEMQQLCEIVRQQVMGKVWLPDPSSSSSSKRKRLQGLGLLDPNAAAAAAAGASSTAAAAGDLVYQVVVDREGRVLGCKPCSAAAAAAYAELPLAAVIQGPALAKVQEKRLETITTADVMSAKPAKKAPRPSSSKVGHLPAAYTPIPEDGVVVLKLTLKPAKQQLAAAAASGADSSSSSTTAQQQQQQQCEVVSKTVGSGKPAVKFILMEPEVSPWKDEDSLTAWNNTGSVLYDDAVTQGSKSNSHSDKGPGLSRTGDRGGSFNPGGLAVSVDGQRVESIEALLKQLLDQSTAAAAAAAGDAAAAGQADQAGN